MPRLFVALDVPDALQTPLRRLRDPDLPVRWTPLAQLHLTLRFLGDVAAEDVAGLRDGLAGIAAPPFRLAGTGLDVFPSRRRPRVIVLPIDAPEALYRLQRAVDRVVQAAGVPADPKPFRPHITVGRAKGARPEAVQAYLEAHHAFRLPAFDVTRFYLYESTLRSQGALHERLAGFPLA